MTRAPGVKKLKNIDIHARHRRQYRRRQTTPARARAISLPISLHHVLIATQSQRRRRVAISTTQSRSFDSTRPWLFVRSRRWSIYFSSAATSNRDLTRASDLFFLFRFHLQPWYEIRVDRKITTVLLTSRHAPDVYSSISFFGFLRKKKTSFEWRFRLFDYSRYRPVTDHLLLLCVWIRRTLITIGFHTGLHRINNRSNF